MILVAGGDSFIFGSELLDQIDGPSLSTYTALLAKESGMKYHCSAWPGNSNNAITRMTINACEKLKNENEKIVAIVTWSFTNRYEFRFNYNTGQKISPWYSINSWSIIDDLGVIEKEFESKNANILNAHKQHLKKSQQIGINNFAQVFFKHVGDSEYYEIYSSLKEILFLQLYFAQNNISYLFVPADNRFYDHPSYFRQKDNHIDSLYNNIDWNKWFFFESGTEPNHTKESRGFYQWAVENKYPIGTTHPLEQAHKEAADLIKEKFNELVTKSLEQI